MRLLVTGGRYYSDEQVVCRMLGFLRPTVLIVGDANGADAHAREWAQRIRRADPARIKDIRVYCAQWDAEGKRAGPLRNQRMLDDGKPDLVLAFPGGRGTEDMCKRAKAAGVPVLRVEQ